MSGQLSETPINDATLTNWIRVEIKWGFVGRGQKCYAC